MGQCVPVKQSFILLMAALALCACGSDKAANEGFRIGTAAIAKVLKGKDAKVASPSLTRAAFDQGGNPLIRARIEKVGDIAYLGKINESRGVITWASVDGSALSMRDGVVIATRGLGTDLMSSAVPTAGVLAHASTVQRQHFYLFGGETEQLRAFNCQVSDAGAERIVVLELAYDTQHRVETCTGDGGLTFENHYWFDNRATIRQSRQWISPDVGILELQDLNR
jgi:Group 4 capsule polysaccharide lipoprotein gfcB, YjbF